MEGLSTSLVNKLTQIIKDRPNGLPDKKVSYQDWKDYCQSFSLFLTNEEVEFCKSIFGSSGFLRFKDILVALNIDGTVSDEKISSFDMLPQPLRMISKIIEYDILDPVWLQIVRDHPEVEVKSTGEPVELKKNHQLRHVINQKGQQLLDGSVCDMTNCGELLITVSIGGLVRLVQQDDLKEVAARNFGKVQSDEQPDENEAVQCSPWKFFVLQRSNDSCKILMSAVMRKKVEDVIKGKKKPKSDVQDDEFNYQYRILILSILTNGLNSDSWLRNEFMYGNFKSSENIYPVNLMISSSPGGHFLSLSTTTSDDSCCSIYKLPSTMTEDQLDSNPSILAELKISSSAVGLFLSCSGSDDGAAEGVLLTVINKQKLVLEVYSLRKQIKIEETPVVPSKKASKGEEKKPEIIFPYVPYRKYRWQLSSTATCFTVSEDSSSLILGLCDGSVCMWDIRIGKSIGIISNHKSSISAICIVPSDDNMLIISGAVDGTLCYTTGDNIGTRIFKTVYFRHDLPCEPILAIKFCTGSGTVIVQYECSIVHCSLSGTLLGRLEAREGSHRAPVVLDFARYADVRVIENSESIPLSNMTPVFDAFSQSVVNEENQFFYVHLPNGLLCTLSKSKVGEIFLVEFDLRTTQDLNAELHPVVPSLHISSKKSLLNPVSAPCAYTLTENTLRVFENQINSTSTAGIKPATFFMSPSHLAKTNINTHRNMRSSRKLKVMKTLNNISDFL